MACAICERRRPRRICPGVHGEICSTCCGTGREIDVACPLDCEYLRESRIHDRPLVPENLPNLDIPVTEELLKANENLLGVLSAAIFHDAIGSPGTVDEDVREALDGLIRTYRTLQSGVYYDSCPANPLAAGIFNSVQDALARFRRAERERLGTRKTRDSDCLSLLAFLQRFALSFDNGRRRCRAFIDGLRELQPPMMDPSPISESSIILP
jgi:hypothetical protein